MCLYGVSQVTVVGSELSTIWSKFIRYLYHLVTLQSTPLIYIISLVVLKKKPASIQVISNSESETVPGTGGLNPSTLEPTLST